MAIFGSDTTKFLKYQINLTDKAKVAALQAGGTGTERVANMEPTKAVGNYAAPMQEETQAFHAPCVRSEWFGADNNFPRDVPSFDRKTGGWFGWPVLFGDTTHFIWRGFFVYAPGDESQIGGEALTPLANRRWVDGFEIPYTADSPMSRGASRHLQGYGGKFDNATTVKTHSPTENGGAATQVMWERFYVRPRVFPQGGKSRLWRCGAQFSPSAGLALDVMPDGTLLLSNISATSVETVLAPSSKKLVVHVWHKIDLIYRYYNANPIYSPTPEFKLYINGEKIMELVDVAAIAGVGIASNDNVASCTLGGGGAGVGFCWDVDDWIGADLPSQPLRFQAPLWAGTDKAPDADHHIYPGHDWNNGSRVALIGGDGFGSDNGGAWAGDWRLSRQRPTGNTPIQSMTVAALNARLTLASDTSREVDNQVNSLGVAAVSVAAFQQRSGVTDGKLGFRLLGTAYVQTIVQNVAMQWNRMVWSFSTMLPITPVASLELIHDAGSGNTILQTLLGTAETIGVFGDEDLVVQATDAVQPKTVRGANGIHNAPYPHSPWARAGIPPIAPVAVAAGTYVGNSTFQDLPFRCPIHFLWIRPLSGAGFGVQWWASMNAAHETGRETYKPDTVIEVLIDPTFAGGLSEDAQEQQTIVRIAGAAADSNLTGVTYQYVAFTDPGMRFCLAGALQAINATIDIVNPLVDSTFTPQAMFLQQERTGESVSVRMFYKGPGNSAAGVMRFDGSGTELASALTVQTGTVTSKPALMAASIHQISYIAFRKDDGSGDPGVPRVLQLASWVGDGAGARTASLAPESGRRPLFAVLVPHNAAPITRDPSHTGTTSTQFPNNALAATGITGGGIDSVSVGAAGNAIGIAYDLFVIPGDSVAGNGGWSINGEFAPVEPGTPLGAQWDPRPASPEENAVPDDGTIDPVVPPDDTPPSGGPDLAGACAVASLGPINQALSHLGVSIRVDDIVLEQTQAATIARLHYQDDVDETLRRHPWPFATRYADLVRVAGTSTVPVNADWQYSYRAPAGMLFARRVANPNLRGRRYDPQPPTFRIGSDATGALVYSNTTNADNLTLTLEYTIRPPCAASSGDAIFRSALSWKLAHSFAPVLARDEKKIGFCWQMFLAVISTAATKAANEVQQEPQGGPDWLDGRDGSPDWLRGRE